jgi:large subunit ribosomal protein L6
MSRVGKMIIELPEKVEILVEKPLVHVKGPSGSLSHEILDFVTLNIESGILKIEVNDEKNRFQRAMWGTTRAIVNNLVIGVTNGFEKKLELNGVGFKMVIQNSQLVLNIGFSHQVIIDIPKEIALTIEKNELIGKSIDKQLLGDFFTRIHNLKPADPYKHKGFKFPGRFYKKKIGKKAK